MKKTLIIAASILLSSLVIAQTTAPPATPPVATDISAVDIQAFIDALPRDAVSDRPIRVVDVTGDYRLGVYGVYRPMGTPGDANLHQVDTTEIYYMLKGSATLVTGGSLIDPYQPETSTTSLRGRGIEGGVTRKIVPGDVVVIPGHTPHWWSELDSDIEYLIFRPDPNKRLSLR